MADWRRVCRPRLLHLVERYPAGAGIPPPAAGAGSERGSGSDHADADGSCCEVFGRRLLRDHLLIGAIEASPLDPFTGRQRVLVLMTSLAVRSLLRGHKT